MTVGRVDRGRSSAAARKTVQVSVFPNIGEVDVLALESGHTRPAITLNADAGMESAMQARHES
jgi:hypothetical protein